MEAGGWVSQLIKCDYVLTPNRHFVFFLFPRGLTGVDVSRWSGNESTWGAKLASNCFIGALADAREHRDRTSHNSIRPALCNRHLGSKFSLQEAFIALWASSTFILSLFLPVLVLNLVFSNFVFSDFECKFAQVRSARSEMSAASGAFIYLSTSKFVKRLYVLLQTSWNLFLKIPKPNILREVLCLSVMSTFDPL